jgi:hypothetical protein
LDLKRILKSYCFVAIIHKLNKSYFHKHSDIAPLVLFRVLFGVMMLLSLVRFWVNGWIETLYLQPKFFFSYDGFSWVKPLGEWTYLIFILAGIASICVAIGFKYRLAIITFFLSFTYIELMDKTTYLNHYYFTSSLAFLLIFLPANRIFSVDSWLKSNFASNWSLWRKHQLVPFFSFKRLRLNPNNNKTQIFQWQIDSVKLLLGIVYFYAGLAKINSDWLFEAMPLGIWLTTKTDFPILGQFMNKRWLHFAFSWSGMVYDLTVPFLLLFSATRIWAYFAVIAFHLLTGWLFPIGMFPYIMIVSTLIFFPAKFHRKVIDYCRFGFSRIKKKSKIKLNSWRKRPLVPSLPKVQASTLELPTKEKTTINFQKKIAFRFSSLIIALFFLFQLTFPFRYLAYPDELFWTEEGFRFSWRVMLMEKAGYAQFKVVDSETGNWFYVDNSEFLTPFQEKQMSFQPDFILEFAHHLQKHYQNHNIQNPQVYVESYVALNGRSSKPYIDPKANLAEVKNTFAHKYWILPFGDEIKGL